MCLLDEGVAYFASILRLRSAVQGHSQHACREIYHRMLPDAVSLAKLDHIDLVAGKGPGIFLGFGLPVADRADVLKNLVVFTDLHKDRRFFAAAANDGRGIKDDG